MARKPRALLVGLAGLLLVLLSYAATDSDALSFPTFIDTASTSTVNTTITLANFNVAKDFSDNSNAEVIIDLSCTSGSIDDDDATATEDDAANFLVTSFESGATCTAIESPVPQGYTANMTGCANQPISNGGLTECTIVNTLNTVSFTVNKSFSPSSNASVTVSLSCTGITQFTPASASATESAPAVFSVTKFRSGTDTCTATENPVPAGYTANQTDCATKLLTVGSPVTCTITNTQNSATLNVAKDFQPNAAGSVTIGVTCTNGGTVARGADTSASETDDANFTIVGFTPGATCTATETVVPTGYTANQANCVNVAISNGGTSECTIVNALNAVTFTINKVYSPVGPTTAVPISVSCTNGATVTPIGSNAAPGTPASFSIGAFNPGVTTCTATETVPNGYTADQTNCANVVINAAGTPSCTITNTANSVQVNVAKNFTDNNSASVTVALDCVSGTVVATDSTASEADDANFNVTGLTGATTCTATESSVPAGYEADEEDCDDIAVTPGGQPVSCTITNTPRTATFRISKDFSDNNAANVTISVSCSGGGSNLQVTAVDNTASESDPADFTIETFNEGTTCTATESPVPSGYTANQTACANKLIEDGETITCTIVNTSNTAGLLQVKKALGPNGAPGSFDLIIASSTNSVLHTTPAVGDDGETPKVPVTAGNLRVREAAANGTDLRLYDTTIVCRKGSGEGAVVAQGAVQNLYPVPVGSGEDVVCVITNTYMVPDACEDLLPFNNVVRGTGGNNTLNGGSGSSKDLILGYGGNDTIDGKAGDDCIVGGEGNDNIQGGSGNDVIFGGDGSDTIAAGSGNDLVFGGDGADNIDGGSDPDELYGDEDDDAVDEDGDTDTIAGGGDTDICVGNVETSCEANPPGGS